MSILNYFQPAPHPVGPPASPIVVASHAPAPAAPPIHVHVPPPVVVQSPGGRAPAAPVAPAKTPASKTTVPPTTNKAGAGNAYGLPTLTSPQELRAEASSQAWKSIQSMMGQLPSVTDTTAPYDAQRAALGPLVAAQRDWLQNVGTYHVGMINGLSQMIHDQVAPVQAQQAGNEQAGGGLGATFNQAPVLDATNPAAAIGGSTNDYIQSLAAGLPAAIGVASGNRINAAADAALLARSQEGSKIQSQEPQLENSLYTSLSSTNFNNWKGELAAIQDGIKNKLAGSKAATTATYDAGRLKIMGENATTAQLRASNATAVAQDKALATASAKDKGILQKALTAGAKQYFRVGGTKVSGSSGSGGLQTILNFYPQPSASEQLHNIAPKPIAIKVQGTDAADLAAKVKATKASYKPPPGVGQLSHWGDTSTRTLPGGSKTAGGVINKPSTYTKRMDAWRTLVAANALTSSPLSTTDLQGLFRQQFGSPAAA